MSTKFIVQPFCSRSETVKYRLSNESWQRGMGTFFSENVPFSYSTSGHFAGKLLKLMKTLCIEQSSINCVELGAGLGLLSKQLLTLAREEDITLFSKLNITISDNAQACLEMIRQLQLFHHFQDRVNLYHESILDPTSVNEQTDLVVLNYVLDSLDCKHIEVRDGQLYEVLVQTEFDNVCPVLESSLWLPKCLEEEDIQKLLFGPPSKEKLNLISDLGKRLHEEFKRVPLEESSLTPFEREEIKEFIGWLDCNENMVFNYSPMASTGLDSILSKMGEKGLCQIYDFGTTQKTYKKPYEKLYSSYGVCSFFDVYFSFVKYKAEKKGFSFHITSFDDTHSQHCLLSKGYDDTEVSVVFNDCFQSTESDALTSYFDEWSLIESYDDLIEDIAVKTKSISPSLLKTYHYLHWLALEQFKRGKLDDAEVNCRGIILEHGPMAVSAYHLLGLIELERKNYNDAIDHFKKCIDTAPYIFDFYLHLSLAYGHLKNIELFQSTSRAYFYYASDCVVWNHYLTYALTLIQTEKRRDAYDVLAWLLKMCQVYKEDVPDYLLVRIDTIIKEFKLV